MLLLLLIAMNFKWFLAAMSLPLKLCIYQFMLNWSTGRLAFTDAVSQSGLPLEVHLLSLSFYIMRRINHPHKKGKLKMSCLGL